MSQPFSYKYKYMGSLQGVREAVFCVTFNNFNLSHRNVFAYVVQNQARIYQLLPGGRMDELQVYEDSDPKEYFYVCKWSVDRESGSPLLLLAGRKALVRVLDVGRGCLLHTLAGHGKEINDIAVHPGRPHLILTASEDESVRLWNIRSRTCVAIFSGEGGHRNKVLSLDFHPWDGHRFLSAGLDTAVKIWSLAPLERLIEESEKARDGYLGGEEAQAAAAAAAGANANGSEEAEGSGAGGPLRPVGSRRAFPTRVVQQPIFSSLKIHHDYVDCVRWLGDLVLSKSVHDVITLWRPHGQAEYRRPPPQHAQHAAQQQQQLNGHGTPAGPPDAAAGATGHEGAGAGGGAGTSGGGGARGGGAAGGGHGGSGGAIDDNDDGDWEPFAAEVVVASRVDKITDFKFSDSNRIWFARFSSDVNHNVLAVGNAKGRVFLFSPLACSASGNQQPRARLLERKCNTVVRQTAVNWDGSTILAACEDGSVHRWDRQAAADVADMEED